MASLAKTMNYNVKNCPTKRAPDAGDSAHIPSLFHALSFFPGLSSRTGWLDGFAVPAPAQVSPKGDDGAIR